MSHLPDAAGRILGGRRRRLEPRKAGRPLWSLRVSAPSPSLPVHLPHCLKTSSPEHSPSGHSSAHRPCPPSTASPHKAQIPPHGIAHRPYKGSLIQSPPKPRAGAGTGGIREHTGSGGPSHNDLGHGLRLLLSFTVFPLQGIITRHDPKVVVTTNLTRSSQAVSVGSPLPIPPSVPALGVRESPA